MASEFLDATISTPFNVTVFDANLQDSANKKLEALAGIVTWSGIDAELSIRQEVFAEAGFFLVQGQDVTDLAWNDVPSLVIPLEFEPLPIETITIPAWPFITQVMPYPVEFADVLVVRDAYPYVTIDYALSDFNIEIIDIEYIDAGNPIIVLDLEFQPLPELTAIIGTDFNIIPLECLEPPPEYWG